MATERKRASTPKRTKVTVAEKSHGTVKESKPGESERVCVKQMERLLSAIHLQSILIRDVLAMWNESKERTEALAQESREGKVQVLGELEQIRTHLARFIDQGIRERGRDERIEAQLAGINERLRERSKVDRVLHHGKMMTAEELARKLDAMEQAKDLEIATLRGEVDRLKSELDASRATAATLERMPLDPIDRWPLPPPRKSWRTTVAKKVAAAPLD
jgi:hypothetical protein